MAEFAAVLYVKDVDRLTAFYARVAGVTISETESGWSRLRGPGFELVVHGIPPDIGRHIVIATPPAVREETPVKIIFPVADLAAARVLAAELGGALNAPDREWRFGESVVCAGHDPEGNVFQLRVHV